MIETARRNFLRSPMMTALAGFAALSAIYPFVTPYMAMASGSYLLLALGFSVRKEDPRMHGMLMTLGILSDLALVLVLQYQRHAIQTAASFTLSPLQQLHILCSSIATVLYFPLLILGFAFSRKPALRARYGARHGKIGTVAFVFRTLGLLLMFTLLKKAS